LEPGDSGHRIPEKVPDKLSSVLYDFLQDLA